MAPVAGSWAERQGSSDTRLMCPPRAHTCTPSACAHLAPAARAPCAAALQLAHLVAEFLEQPTVDPAVREQFLQFMAVRATRCALLVALHSSIPAVPQRPAACRAAALLERPPASPPLRAWPGLHRCRSYPRLESALDWLLSIYKFVFPFLVGCRWRGMHRPAHVEQLGWRLAVALRCSGLIAAPLLSPLLPPQPLPAVTLPPPTPVCPRPPRTCSDYQHGGQAVGRHQGGTCSWRLGSKCKRRGWRGG